VSNKKLFIYKYLYILFNIIHSMLRVQQKISTGLGVLQFFTLTAWTFRSDNYASLWNKLGDQDKAMLVK